MCVCACVSVYLSVCVCVYVTHWKSMCSVQFPAAELFPSPLIPHLHPPMQNSSIFHYTCVGVCGWVCVCVCVHVNTVHYVIPPRPNTIAITPAPPLNPIPYITDTLPQPTTSQSYTLHTQIQHCMPLPSHHSRKWLLAELLRASAVW